MPTFGHELPRPGMTKLQYDPGVTVERLTISVDAELAEAVRQAARDDAQNLSAWLVEAARRRLATRGLRDVIVEWEAEHGTFSDSELADARTRLRVSNGHCDER